MQTYQSIRLQHIAGNPPGTDPQRPSETFENYKLRMNAAGLQPDINIGETDEDYVARLATYVTYPNPNEEVASNAIHAVTATSASYATTYTNVISSSFADQATRADTCGIADYAAALQGAVTNGTYNFDATTPGNVLTMTIVDGVITAITVVPGP